MDAKGVRNMYSILVDFNKHNTARVASCWFIIYYRLVMHGNSNIKFFRINSVLKQGLIVSKFIAKFPNLTKLRDLQQNAIDGACADKPEQGGGPTTS